ncbi:fused MFS/spermidine synthase [Thermodesulfobacteriota bacterium]
MNTIESSYRLESQNLPLYFLFFSSGIAGLIYEVLWMKELGFLFGNTAYAVATTLTVFFLGLSTGGYTWGRRSATLPNPLKTYAFLEFGIALTAGLYFFILHAYRAIYSPLFDLFSGMTFVFILVKLILALGILFLPAFFMGGTLPVMGQHIIRRPGDLAGKGTFLYAINTVGAATGAFLAGFILPHMLGLKLSYFVAIGTNVLIGITALTMSRLTDPGRFESLPSDSFRSPDVLAAADRYTFLEILAFTSGFLTLGLEVLWTRMFSQAFQNSVYMFSLILIVFLLALTIGSFVANRLSTRSFNPVMVLVILLALSGIAVIHTRGVFFIAGGIEPQGYYMLDWWQYVYSMFRSVTLVIFVPVIIMGSVFPYLLKAAEGRGEKPGPFIGRMVSINTAGSIAGSLLAGFVFINILGMWASINLFALAYLVQAVWLVLAFTSPIKKRWAAALVILSVMMLAIGTSYNRSLVSLKVAGETVLDVVEGSHATVSVVKGKGMISLRMNNHYGLGSAKNFPRQRFEAELPMAIHPDPKTVFFLGMGTGITAGAALKFPVKKVTVCEIMPEVVDLSRKYFKPYINGLFEDPRVEIVVEDGRNYLLGTDKKYDLVVADLFLPYKAGVGSLYTTDHFKSVKARLNPGGIFVQWLSIYQFSEEELQILARTFLNVFDQVTLWRADFSSYLPFIAVVCYKEDQRLDAETLSRKAAKYKLFDTFKHTFAPVSGEELLSLYCGNLSRAKSVLPPGPLNTDDMPLIEYSSPITIRNIFSDHIRCVNQDVLHKFIADIFDQVPPEEDPYLKNTPADKRGYVWAGLDLFGYEVFKRSDREKARALHKKFLVHLSKARG